MAQKSGILSDTPELTTIRIATVPEKMMYDVKQLEVKPGKKIKLTFANPAITAHSPNFTRVVACSLRPEMMGMPLFVPPVSTL